MSQDSEQDRETLLEQKRAVERARRERWKAEQQRREAERRRVREWAAANPEKVRESRERWKTANPEKRKQSQREYYHRNREKRLETARDYNARRARDPEHAARQREYRDRHKDRLNELQRQKRSTPEGRDHYNSGQRERRRVERRRRELGLPPRPRHRPTTNERIRNEVAATVFFTRRRSVARRREFKEYVETRTNWDRAAHDITQRLDARRDAARTARIRRDLTTIDAYLSSPRGVKLREEVRMDARARAARGKPPYPDLEEEARRRTATALDALQKPRGGPAPTADEVPQHRIKREADSHTGPVTVAARTEAPARSTATR